MIGTFWNLCRACPSMPVDKLHSEYRSTYRWHEYTGPRQEVIRKPPQPLSGAKEEEEKKNVENTNTVPNNQEKVDLMAGHLEDSFKVKGGGVEPALPRRKKNPILAYRTNDFITSKERDCQVSTSLDRARCADRERERSNRRSKSEGPPNGPAAPKSPSIEYGSQRVLRSDSDPSEFAQQLMISSYPLENGHAGGLKSAISRISTEYRLQFAWPRGNKNKEDEKSSAPRKSLSMGAIRPTNTGIPSNMPPAPIHKKRITDADKLEGSAELEPLVSGQDSMDYMGGEEKIQEESVGKEEKPPLDAEFKTEYKKKFRPFSQYDYVEGRFKPKKEPEPQFLSDIPHGDSWFSEVLELRKKAGEYKHRGWGTELVPEHIAELYNKQMTLWEQVSRRSSLSALSLASSTHRSISKEEKEKENNKKSSPTKSAWPHAMNKATAQKGDKNEEIKKEGPPRSRRDNFVRHHLERTTGVGEEGILHSPTREKLEPVIPKKKESAPDINRSPQKTHHPGRSHSAGPNTTSSDRSSPKRTQRPPASAPKPIQGDKRPRPKDKGDEVDSSEAEILEPVVKSPPEPTRVKSPEQILMRSPEPVNWTVPLDTGKTFTVTQNVSEGESLCRPQSESKARKEASVPPPSQSAPPLLGDESDWNKEEPEDAKSSHEKPVAGTTLRCLEDPSFSFDSGQSEAKPLSTEIMEKARSRFDQFWGKSNPEGFEK